ncbi:hypothetical protein H6504_00590 [Candidatus Woesearchaeota archaeon]|nr:hypothetical protein [Candidatus Woesearchaeota archaeon]
MQELLKEALAEVTPDVQEVQRITAKTEKVLHDLNGALTDAHAIVGGSIAKQSFLKHARDADIYVQFSKGKYADANLSDELEAVLRKLGYATERVHGSRDYFQMHDEDGFLLEIIPIIEITDADEALNITDISPLHVKWVLGHAKLHDDMRLAKAFARGGRCYGAESYIHGFSGYSLEILTAFYGGFVQLVEAATKWKEQQIIDPEQHHKHVLFEVNASKLLSPLVLIDPVQKGRNASASLNRVMFQRFIKHAKSFLKSPNIVHFRMDELTASDIKGKVVCSIEVSTQQAKEDVAGCRILKVYEYIRDQLEKYGFTVQQSDWTFDKRQKGMLFYGIKEEELPREHIWRGPPLSRPDDVVKFKEKYDDVYEEDGRCYARVTRDFIRPLDLLTHLVAQTYVKERTTSVNIVA